MYHDTGKNQLRCFHSILILVPTGTSGFLHTSMLLAILSICLYNFFFFLIMEIQYVKKECRSKISFVACKERVKEKTKIQKQYQMLHRIGMNYCYILIK